MERPCPKCEQQIEPEAFACDCGYIFVDELEAARARETELSVQSRRGRGIKMAAMLLLIPAVLLASLAVYSGSFFRPKFAAAESTDEPRPKTATIVNDETNPPPPVPDVPKDDTSFTVTNVFTGDAIGVADGKNIERRVSLLGLRVPKMDENFGSESRQNLANLVADGSVTIIRSPILIKDADVVAEVFINGSNIGIEQLRRGLAWPDDTELAALSDDARVIYVEAAAYAKINRFGVWSAGEVARDLDISRDSRHGKNISESRSKIDIRPLRRIKGMQNYSGVSPSGEAVPTNEPPATVSEPARSVTSDNVIIQNTEAPPDARARSKYVKGQLGGCYYMTASGQKSYVDRSMCN